MDDYQETRLHEPDPRPGEAKALKRRRALAWAGYIVVFMAVLAMALSSAWWFC